jgi:hypothetical protein
MHDRDSCDGGSPALKSNVKNRSKSRANTEGMSLSLHYLKKFYGFALFQKIK